MNRRVLPFDCSAEQMDQGHGMRYHPCFLGRDGRLHQLHIDLHFAKEKGKFYRQVDRGEPMVTDVWCDRIGDGHPRSAGDPYPEHWLVCPFTGEALTPPRPEVPGRRSQSNDGSFQAGYGMCFGEECY